MWPKEPLPGGGSKLAGSPGPSGLVAECWHVAKGREAEPRPRGRKTPRAPPPAFGGAQAVWRSHTTSWESPTGSGVATAGTLAPGAPGSGAAARPLDSAQAGAGTREGFLGGHQRTLQLDRAPHFASRRQENLSSAARRKAANILFHHPYFFK